MEKKKFHNLLKLLTNDNYFTFNNEFFKQIEGLAMGNPISATFANIFLCYHEANWLNECPIEFKPIIYKRYVDDTFVVFKKKEHAQLFFTYLNNKHNNIRFTMESEKDGIIPFLDILIDNRSDSIQCSVYRKITFTGLGINFLSHCAERFKLNTFQTLFYRAFNLSSNYFIFHNEVMFLKDFFINNGFNSDIFFKQLKIFLNKTFSPNTEKQGPKKQEMYIRLIYFNAATNDSLKHELHILFERFYPQIKLRLVFFNNFKIKSLINHKNRLPNHLCSFIVYKFKCSKCSLEYVGSSTRSLITRYFEHKGWSSRTRRPLSRPLTSSVRNHIDTCKVGLSIEDFSVIYRTNNTSELRIAESLIIK